MHPNRKVTITMVALKQLDQPGRQEYLREM